VLAQNGSIYFNHMKNILKLLVLLLALSGSIASGQTVKSDTSSIPRKNLVGLDATSLLRQFFNLNTQSFYFSPYLISYRRFFKSNALRLHFGGQANKSDNVQNDTMKYSSSMTRLNLAIGFEHFVYLSKKWNFNFGIDAIHYLYNNTFKQPYSSTSYYQQINKESHYGLTPLVGVQFKFNSRLSLTTETRLQFAWYNSTSKTENNSFPSNNSSSTGQGYQTEFIVPTSLTLNVHF
jgi:hypothetical protein